MVFILVRGDIFVRGWYLLIVRENIFGTQNDQRGSVAHASHIIIERYSMQIGACAGGGQAMRAGLVAAATLWPVRLKTTGG